MVLALGAVEGEIVGHKVERTAYAFDVTMKSVHNGMATAHRLVIILFCGMRAVRVPRKLTVDKISEAAERGAKEFLI